MTIKFSFQQGSILLFLDAHIEATKGWLEPLVARIANDRSVVAVPMADAINAEDMAYHIWKETFVMLRSNLIFVRLVSLQKQHRF